MPFKLYIASKTKHAPQWRALRRNGLSVISTWIDEAGVGETECFRDLWMRCVREASNADITLIYKEEGEVLKGAFIEAGAALASGKPVFAVGCGEFSFVNHELVTQFDDLSAAIEAIMVAQVFTNKIGESLPAIASASEAVAAEMREYHETLRDKTPAPEVKQRFSPDPNCITCKGLGAKWNHTTKVQTDCLDCRPAHSFRPHAYPTLPVPGAL